MDDRQDVLVDHDELRAVAARAAGVLGIPAGGLSVLLVGPEEIAAMKRDALGVHAPTDVLSFPIDDPDDPAPGPVIAGDVVLCPAFAARQARALGRSLDDELAALVVHGMLHLRGRDHRDAASEVAMAGEMRAVLARARRRPA